MVYTMKIYVDGGCRGNGQPGSIAAAAACIQHRSGNYNCFTRVVNESPDGDPPTNQRAEITAIIIALEIAVEKYRELDGNPYLELEIFSDSKYAVNCMNEWIYKWERNGYINSAGNPVANQDLIREASGLDDDLNEEGRVTYTWIPRERNEVADKWCNKELDEIEEQRKYADLT
ncbi:ribonuclease H1, putative [Talaromyces stipitatus ATCC 10500]|uniref:ribonuclease H n=1 Tax=Talaromyces stipitatus (strain ATCC 10500 / CBS 375.48 / QM 6759 / NRRL 1006) TaxID=441959 RepID=B8MMS1_TALSN|nr:ribonuclease H1, putative [Talaromyces stipitatus ATCC 10500]EED13827.1 ribonuclease H1, putative [Talaromyces stipitatus ATCC 10500]